MTEHCRANVFPFGVCSNSGIICVELANDGINIDDFKDPYEEIDIVPLAEAMRETYDAVTLASIVNGQGFNGCLLHETIIRAASRAQYFGSKL